jgi:hypothetical protein
VYQRLSQYSCGVITAGWRADDASMRRWLTRYGAGIAPVSDEAWDLLARRLAVRRRANLAASSLPAAGAAFMIASAYVANFDAPPSDNSAAVAWWAASCAAWAAAPAVRGLAQRRGERAVSSQLRRRVSASAQIPIWRVLGPLRLVNLGLAGALNVALLVALFVVGAGRALPWIYAATLLVISAFALGTFRQVVRRPALAVDSDSLIIDARLRGGDAYWAIWPLVLLLAGATVPIGLLEHDTTARSLSWFSLIAFPLLAGLEAAAQSHDKRRPPVAAG